MIEAIPIFSLSKNNVKPCSIPEVLHHVEKWTILKGEIPLLQLRPGISTPGNTFGVLRGEESAPAGNAYRHLMQRIRINSKSWFVLAPGFDQNIAANFLMNLHEDQMRNEFGVPKDGVMVLDMIGRPSQRLSHFCQYIEYDQTMSSKGLGNWYNTETFGEELATKVLNYRPNTIVDIAEKIDTGEFILENIFITNKHVGSLFLSTRGALRAGGFQRDSSLSRI